LHGRGLSMAGDLLDAKSELKRSRDLLRLRDCNEQTRQSLQQQNSELGRFDERHFGLWRSERRRFDEYAAKTEELDRVTDLLLADSDRTCQALIGIIHAMQEENESLRTKVADCESQVAELMSQWAHTRREARIDTITKLPNRRAWEERLAGLRCDGSQYLAVADLDRLKSINDVYGHSAGDAVLNLLGTLLRNSHSVSAFRIGGDEFGLIAERRNEDEAYDAFDSVRSRIERAKLKFDEHELGMTISIGMTHVSVRDSVNAAVARADQAMYVAKKAGGNRVQCQRVAEQGASAP